MDTPIYELAAIPPVTDRRRLLLVPDIAALMEAGTRDPILSVPRMSWTFAHGDFSPALPGYNRWDRFVIACPKHSKQMSGSDSYLETWERFAQLHGLSIKLLNFSDEAAPTSQHICSSDSDRQIMITIYWEEFFDHCVALVREAADYSDDPYYSLAWLEIVRDELGRGDDFNDWYDSTPAQLPIDERLRRGQCKYYVGEPDGARRDITEVLLVERRPDGMLRARAFTIPYIPRPSDTDRESQDATNG